MEKQKLILDCDPGHDDAVAIMLAAKSEKLDLLGITVVAGNQTLEKTQVNARNVCQCLGLEGEAALGKALEKYEKRFAERGTIGHQT